jgi:peptidyl-prolyl cis-trans isomerase C
MTKIILILCCQFLICSAFAQTSSVALVFVNGAKITSGQLKEWVDYIAKDGKETPELRDQILSDMVLREAIQQNAKKSGLLDSPGNAFKLKLAHQNAVMDLWFMQYFKSQPITDADVRSEYYNQLLITKDPRNTNEYQLSQIVVPTEAEANQIILKINSGVTFDKLANEHSIDKISGPRGGLMGWILPTLLADPIRDAVIGMSKSQITVKPIQVKGLWHVLSIDNIKPFVMPDFDQMKPEIAQALAEQRRQEAINSLMKSVKITQGN